MTCPSDIIQGAKPLQNEAPSPLRGAGGFQKRPLGRALGCEALHDQAIGFRNEALSWRGEGLLVTVVASILHRQGCLVSTSQPC